MEKKISSIDGKIALHYENGIRLKHRLDMLEQICLAPQVYAQLCVEVYRRRQFAEVFQRVSLCYFIWPSDTESRLLTLLLPFSGHSALSRSR